MNLFLVTSPLQLLCAIEAKHEYQTTDNILILREEKANNSITQTNLLLDKSEWDHIVYLGRKSKIWEVKKLHHKLKSINPTLKFSSVFYADYSAWRTNVLMNNIYTENEVMFDDGVGTIREFNDKIQPRLIVSRKKASRDILLKLIGLNPPREIYPRTTFSFFTFFKLPPCEFPVRENNLTVMKRRLSTDTCFKPDAPIGFIGQGMVAEKGINLDYYASMLEQLITENKRQMVYFPHRTEAEFVKQRLSVIKGLTYHESDLPLELEISTKELKLSRVYGIASTASISLQKLYPFIPIIDLNVDTKHYMIEEFGNNFQNVARLLNLESLNFEVKNHDV
tara:strand:- start:670 stop:1680 length:1011 start_codon:yes stop_codon:yes gene_type:complete